MKIYKFRLVGHLNMLHSRFPIVSCSDNYFNAVKLFIISKTLEKMSLPRLEPVTIAPDSADVTIVPRRCYVMHAIFIKYIRAHIYRLDLTIPNSKKSSRLVLTISD